MEHYDGEFYTLRLFSPIEGEIYSLNSTEEGIHLTAYEMENYSSFIRDHMEGVGLLGKRNQKLMTYFNNAKRLHKPVSLSLDLEAYEGRLWSVLQADSQDKLTHEEVQSLAETWGMIAAGGFIREMQETRILVPDGELMVFLGNEGLDYFVCPEEVLKGTAHTLKPALDVAIYSEAYFPERSYQGAKLRLPAEPAFLKDAKMRAFIHENEPYRIELLGNWPSFLKNILEKAASVTLEEVNVLACLVTHMDSSQIETYEAAIQMRQEENIDVPVVLTSVNTVSSAGRDKYSTVGIDNLQSAYSATEYLIKKGHENIAIMIGEKNDFCVSWWRYKGYIKALMDYNIKINDENLIIGDYDSEKAYEETMKLLKHRKDITAIFVISDFMAIGAAKAVSDSGLRVGEDISIIGFDGMDVSCYYNPGITTINQPKKEMAEKSVEILFELLKKKGENKHILLDTELIERESCMDISKK